MIDDPGILWLLWLRYGLLAWGDRLDWSRAMLAWKYDLSRQDVHLIELIAAGCTNQEIAERLEVAEVNTIKKRINRIFDKMGVNDRLRVAVIAGQFGLGQVAEGPRIQANTQKAPRG